MLSSTYIISLLIALVSPFTEVCGQTTPWSSVDDHARLPINTLSPPKLHPPPPPTTLLEVPQCISSAALPRIMPPAPIHSNSPPTIATPHLAAFLCPLPHSSLRDLSRHILRHHPHYFTDTGSPVIPPDATLAASPWSPQAFRLALQRLAALHRNTNSYEQKSGPEGRQSTSHPHSRANSLLSSLAVPPAKVYGSPTYKFQISNLVLLTRRAHLVQSNLIAANLVSGLFPPLDLQTTPHKATSTFFQPSSLAPPSPPHIHSPSAPQDHLLSCLWSYLRAQYTSLLLADGQSCAHHDRHRRRRATHLTTLLVHTPPNPLPSPPTTMTSLAVAASALITANKASAAVPTSSTANNVSTSPRRAHASFKDALLSPSRATDAAPIAGPVISPDDQPTDSSQSPTDGSHGQRPTLGAGSKPEMALNANQLADSRKATALAGAAVVKPPQTPRVTASNSFRRKVRDGKIDTDASGRAKVKEYAYAYWSPSAPENKTGAESTRPETRESVLLESP